MKYFDDLDRQSLFLYIALFVIIVFVFTLINIQLNLVFGVMIAVAIVIYLYINNVYESELSAELDKKKLDSILPFPDTTDHDEISDFLFSIQDFYQYNQRAYEDTVMQIDYFFDLYDEVRNNNSMAGINYGLMIDQKRNIINSLKTIIFGMEPNLKYDEKLEKATAVINILLDRRINMIHKIYDDYVYKTGLNTRSIVIVKNDISSSNLYDDKYFSYDMV